MCNDCYFDLNNPIFVQDTSRKSWQLVDWQQVMLGGVMEREIQCLDQVKRYVKNTWNDCILRIGKVSIIHGTFESLSPTFEFFLVKASQLIQGDLWSQTDAKRII